MPTVCNLDKRKRHVRGWNADAHIYEPARRNAMVPVLSDESCESLSEVPLSPGCWYTYRSSLELALSIAPTPFPSSSRPVLS